MTNDPLESFIAHLPTGEFAYTREPDGTWGVGLFPKGAPQRLQTVATGMDKNLACWMALKLNQARAESSQL